MTRKAIEVDYDRDISGVYRSKSANAATANARPILDSSSTKVNTPFELIKATEVDDEEDGFYDATITDRMKNLGLSRL